MPFDSASSSMPMGSIKSDEPRYEGLRIGGNQVKYDAKAVSVMMIILILGHSIYRTIN
jgi:hypothetical protein